MYGRNFNEVSAHPVTPSFVRSDRGGVTAEFAILMPAVMLVLVLAIGALGVSAQKLALTSAAADLARLEARGDSAVAARRINELPGGSTVHRERDGPLLCVTITSHPAIGLLSALSIRVRNCAAVSDLSPMGWAGP